MAPAPQHIHMPIFLRGGGLAFFDKVGKALTLAVEAAHKQVTLILVLSQNIEVAQYNRMHASNLSICKGWEYERLR